MLNRSRPVLTSLDDRLTPAVGALGALEGTSLTVVGDNADNTIILRVVGDQLQIDGGRIATAAGLVDAVPVDDVELVAVIAGAGNDQVFIDSDLRAAANIVAGDGDDVVVAGGGASELFGGAGNDLLVGGRAADRLYGEGGTDTLAGGGGSDVAFGGLGADTFSRSVDRRADNFGADVVTRSEPTAPTLPAVTAPAAPALGTLPQPDAAVSATLVGDVLQVLGTNGADTVQLVFANNSYSLADGTPIQTDAGTVGSVSASRVRSVTVLSYAGNDRIDLSASRVATRVVAGAGDDVVLGGRAADAVFGNAGNDQVTTNAGDDVVYAGAGDDVVSLGSGDDVAYLGAGSNTLTGGSGRDRLGDPATANTVAADVELLGAEVDRPSRRRR